jgi:transcriptional regulator CtsR
MNNKRRVYRLLEHYINDCNKESVEGWYGKGSVIKIHNMNFTQQKSVVIEIVIVLGDVISEAVMDERMASLLISEGLVYFFPGLSIHLIHSWDS